MKKILTMIMICITILSLVSCKEKTGGKIDDFTGITEENPNTGKTENVTPTAPTEEVGNYLEGTDAAKMLLAQNRLNPQKLSGSANIFDGEQVFRNLVSKIRGNKKYKDSTFEDDITITDTSVEWKNSDKNYSNSMSYFENLSGNVASCAERGAEMIKLVKSRIRVVNCWVKNGNDNILLLVDENSETIIRKNDLQVDVCRRYTDTEGQDVYEIYYNNEVGQTRMKYIENTLVEYFHDNHTSEFEHHFMADNTKGYWDVFGDLSGEHYSATVIKNEMVYDYIGTYGEEKTDILDIVSNDRLNDVMTFSFNDFELAAHAFNGIDKFVVEIESKDDIVKFNPDNYSGKVFDHDGFYYPSNSSEIKLVLNNGKVYKAGDVDGKVRFNGNYLTADHGLKVYYQHINVSVEGKTLEEKYINLKEFFEANGITCKYDLDEIFENALLAYEEIASQSKYRLWNDVVVNSKEKADEALEIEKNKFIEFKELLALTEELEVIDIDDQDALNSKIDFADINSYTQEKVKFENNIVIVNNLILSITKSPLLDKNETYSLKFGLIDVNNIFNEIQLEGELDSISYNGEDSFELTYDGEFSLTNCGIGQYVLAVYLATSEGIRISELEYVKVDEYTEYSTKDYNHIVNVYKTENGYLCMNVEKNPDIYMIENLHYIPSYEELMDHMGSQANSYGMVPETSKLEVLSENEEYVELTSNIVSGEYRLYYQYYTEEGYKDAYVYLSLIVDVITFEHTCNVITLEELKALFSEKVQLSDDFIIEIYSEVEDDYLVLDQEAEITSGKYKVAYIIIDDEIEIYACIYLSLTVEGEELPSEDVNNPELEEPSNELDNTETNNDELPSEDVNNSQSGNEENNQ